jgi:hypothetical protein
MNIAVFADVHGRVLLCFKLCARWQRETGEPVDLILQAGDLGAFPDPARLDRATVRHAAHDPSELGFAEHFVRRGPVADAVLAQTACPLVFVRGNHEDQQWLDALESRADGPTFPVDPYGRVHCLKTGIPYVVGGDGDPTTVLGIGRVGPPIGETVLDKPVYIQPHERARLNLLGEHTIDVLLTHDAARDFVRPGYGVAETRLILDYFRPAYHFYGHVETPLDRRTDANGVTVSCKLSDLTWDRSERGAPLNAGAMGILRWHDAEHQRFEVVEAPWLREYTAATWTYVP